MKVGFLMLNPVWEPLGFSVRPRMLMIHLARLGVEVHLFSPFKPDPTLGDGIHYHQLAVPPIPPAFSTVAYRITRSAFKLKPFFKHFLANEATLKTMVKRLASSLRPILKEQSWDVLQGEQDLAGAALLEARPSDEIPVVTDLLDLWADEEVMIGRIEEGGPAFHALQKMTGQALTGSDLILVGNEEVSAYVVGMYGVDPVKVLISNNAGELRQERRKKTDNVPRVIYAGYFEVHEYVDLFAQCLSFLKKLAPRVEPLIVGKGPDKRRLQRLLAGFGSGFERCLKKPMNREDLLKLLTNCDVGVVTTLKSYTTPMKLFDYLSVGLPVVAFKGFWWSKLIEQHGLGLTADHEPERLAEAIATLLCSADLDRYSVNAKEFVSNQSNWFEASKALIRAYERLAER